MTEIKTETRLPPNAVEAEQALLGCLLIDNVALPRIMGIIIPESFYKPAHGKIYKSMLDLFEKTENLSNSYKVINQKKKFSEAYFFGAHPHATNRQFDHYLNYFKFVLFE